MNYKQLPSVCCHHKCGISTGCANFTYVIHDVYILKYGRNRNSYFEEF